MVVVCVKPTIVGRVLQELRPCVTPDSPLITSVALGVTLSAMESALPPESRVMRIMPNTPALVQLGASVFTRGTHTTQEDAEVTQKYVLLPLLSSCTCIHRLPQPPHVVAKQQYFFCHHTSLAYLLHVSESFNVLYHTTTSHSLDMSPLHLQVSHHTQARIITPTMQQHMNLMVNGWCVGSF